MEGGQGRAARKQEGKGLHLAFSARNTTCVTDGEIPGLWGAGEAREGRLLDGSGGGMRAGAEVRVGGGQAGSS